MLKGHILWWVYVLQEMRAGLYAPGQIPWFETPIVFDIRAKPRNIASLTGTKGA